MASGPLDGIRVVDLTSVFFGPYGTQILADQGADVIKVEAPGGDPTRGIEPSRSPGMGAVFLSVNRNKRSVVLDLKQAAAREALLRIVAGAQVFVHSMRPQAIARLKLTYADLKPLRPDLIHVSAWGFSSRGPYAEKPAYDDIIQALSGIADLPRRRGDHDEPAYMPMTAADKTAGLMLAQATTAALLHQARTGEGQEIEVPMFECLTAYNLLENMAGATFVPPAGGMGYDRNLAPFRRPYRTSDGHLSVLPYNTKQWQAFFRAAERPDMVDDPRVTDPRQRSLAIAELYVIVAEIMAERSTADWLARMEEADVPAMPINRLEDLLEDPHLTATDFFLEVEHPSEGRLRTMALPTRLAATPGGPTRRPAPRLGEHSREVLTEAGLTERALAELIASGAVGEADPISAAAD
ncbi:MAG: CoA transferase [Hyphomicrobiales bacterium]|nr:CoA transferase [Hyphomicrobiales bacterium]